MDRFTWGAVVGVASLCLFAVVVALVGRRADVPPDLSTPDGLTKAYILAVQEKRADDAWALLDSPQAAGPGPGERQTLEIFRQTVNNTYGNDNRRIRIQEVKPEGDTARVDVEVTTVSTAPLWFGFPSSSRRLTFSLRRSDGSWRITSAPSVWELR